MTLVMYLLDHTINEVCHGNRSECARKLNMKYNELRKVIKRVEGGATSGMLMNALLDLYWREDISLDDVLRRYTESRLGEDYENIERGCQEAFDSVREIVSDKPQDTQGMLHILKHADVLGEAIHENFCNKLCDRQRFKNKECPMRKYAKFSYALKDELGHALK